MKGSFGGDGGNFFVVLLGLLIKTHFLRRKITENKMRKESTKGYEMIEFDANCRKLDMSLLPCEV